jgi:hypothetical protein
MEQGNITLTMCECEYLFQALESRNESMPRQITTGRRFLSDNITLLS